jgi:hypothetical protein
MTSASSPGRTAAERSALARGRYSAIAVALPQLLQQLAHPSGCAQLAGDVGSKAQIALRIEPASLDIRRQLAHGLSESRKNLFDLARSEPPLPGHSRRLPGLLDGKTSTAFPTDQRLDYALVSLRPAGLKQRQLIALLLRRLEAGGIESLRRPLVEAELAAGSVEAQPQHVGVGARAAHALRPG